MRPLIVILVLMLFPNMALTQIYEVGIFAGGSNVIGDVGPTNYINPNAMAIGIIGKWNRSPRHSFRASIIYTKLEGADANSSDPRRKERDFSFSTNGFEISGGLEFTFLDFDLHESSLRVTPYLYTGITALTHDNYYFSSTGEYIDEGTSSWAFGIPMVIGVKSNISRHFILAAEIGVRYAFSDEIDGSIADGSSGESAGFGNTNSNDWYTFTGLTLTYTFGRKPCYCNF